MRRELMRRELVRERTNARELLMRERAAKLMQREMVRS